MTTRTSSAEWKGNLTEGSGVMRLASGAAEIAYTRSSRFAEDPGSNPEELIGAAHAGCYSMYLSAILSKSGFPPTRIRTTATVHLVDGPTINLIELNSEGEVPGCDEKTFLEHAERAKKECPVSKALAAVEMKLAAKLIAK